MLFYCKYTAQVSEIKDVPARRAFDSQNISSYKFHESLEKSKDVFTEDLQNYDSKLKFDATEIIWTSR